MLFQCFCLGDHTAHSHRQTGGGDHQQNRVNIIGGGEITVAGFPDDHLQGDFKEHTDYLDNGCRQGQYRSAA